MEINFANSNLTLLGTGLDNNGNSVVKLKFPNTKSFSIQTNGTLKNTQNARGVFNAENLPAIEAEIVAYVAEFGTKFQKSKLRQWK